ncbi:MAG: hypothetical protein ABIS06_19550 [Vicinamibacterales bacterium]
MSALVTSASRVLNEAVMGFLALIALATAMGPLVFEVWPATDRIVDVACIVGPLLSFLPQVSDTVRGALVFRLLRVGRAVAFNARAGVPAVQRRGDPGGEGRRGTAVVMTAGPREQLPPRQSTWAELLTWVFDRKPGWYYVSDIDRQQFLELASAAHSRARA